MRVIIESDPAAATVMAAEIIAAQICANPRAVLGLATGGTPVGCYQQLIAWYREGKLDFSQVRSFNLDEYVGLPADHPESYHRFMREQLFDHINMPAENWRVPDGMADDLEAAGDEYEAAIAQAGGIDLQLLGIGRDGHMAFNEPGSSLAGLTRVKHLTWETIEDNARFFGSTDAVPRLAITMGVGSILKARHCLLLATGEAKAEAIAAAVEGPVTASVTASALQMHRRATVVLDESAASQLRRADYYRLAEAAERQRHRQRAGFGVIA